MPLVSDAELQFDVLCVGDVGVKFWCCVVFWWLRIVSAAVCNACLWTLRPGQSVRRVRTTFFRGERQRESSLVPFCPPKSKAPVHFMGSWGSIRVLPRADL